MHHSSPRDEGLGPARYLTAADGSGDVHFRVAEDQTFADAEDSLVQLHEDARVSIAHPIQLSEPELAGFRQLFVDYEIIQPFPQLERGVFRLSADERETPSLACFVGRKVESAALTKLLGGPGWVQGEGYRIQKPLGPRRFGVRYTHHYAHGDTPAAEELLELQLSEGGKPVPLSRLTEIEASELLRDLETLPRVP